MKIDIYKAQRTISNVAIPDVTIQIGPHEIPERIRGASPQAAMEIARDMFAFDAKAIVEALQQSLPGGTIDQILIELLKAKASGLVVPS